MACGHRSLVLIENDDDGAILRCANRSLWSRYTGDRGGSSIIGGLKGSGAVCGRRYRIPWDRISSSDAEYAQQVLASDDQDDSAILEALDPIVVEPSHNTDGDVQRKVSPSMLNGLSNHEGDAADVIRNIRGSKPGEGRGAVEIGYPKRQRNEAKYLVYQSIEWLSEYGEGEYYQKQNGGFELRSEADGGRALQRSLALELQGQMTVGAISGVLTRGKRWQLLDAIQVWFVEGHGFAYKLTPRGQQWLNRQRYLRGELDEVS